MSHLWLVSGENNAGMLLQLGVMIFFQPIMFFVFYLKASMEHLHGMIPIHSCNIAFLSYRIAPQLMVIYTICRP